MAAEPMTSYAQNGEDVVLYRALAGIQHGCYLDVGANDPVVDSVTKAFYDRGWRGIHVEPVPQWAHRLRQARPDEVVLEAAVTADGSGPVTLFEVVDTGLSTLVRDHEQGRFEECEIQVAATTLADVVAQHVGERAVHFLKVDVEGAEAEVLASVDLTRFRPWVLVIEATAPNSATPTHDAWEPSVLAAGYRFCLFDGLSRFYVADEHAELAPRLAYPACPLDNYVIARTVAAEAERDAARDRLEQQRREIEELRHQVVHWRGKTFKAWAQATNDAGREAELRVLREAVDSFESTISWRVTKPLRAVRSRMPR